MARERLSSAADAGLLSNVAERRETTSAARQLLDVLGLLGFTEAALYDELSKRRGKESSPDRKRTDCNRLAADERLPDVRDMRVRQVLEMIESQLPQSVQRLAREAGLCSDHFQRLFKQETGRNLGEFLGERRLHKAAELLLTSDMSIKEIAFIVGYKHQSSFVRAFQREFRQTPGHYRRAPVERAKRRA